MKNRIIRVGNSQGVRIPRPLLEQAGLGEELELEVRSDEIVIRSAKQADPGVGDARPVAEPRIKEPPDDEVVGSGWDEEEWIW